MPKWLVPLGQCHRYEAALRDTLPHLRTRSENQPCSLGNCRICRLNVMTCWLSKTLKETIGQSKTLKKNLAKVVKEMGAMVLDPRPLDNYLDTTTRDAIHDLMRTPKSPYKFSMWSYVQVNSKKCSHKKEVGSECIKCPEKIATAIKHVGEIDEQKNRV